MIRAVIVDDEPLAREGLRLRLAAEPGVTVVGEAGSGDEAVALVGATRPDLLFLDVDLPRGDGFDTLARLAAVHLPLVVFVTAYDAHALRAFEVRAVDYLLKPVARERLAEALRRVRGELARGGASEAPARVAELLQAREPGGDGGLSRFVVRERDGFRLVPEADVRWITSAANYVELHTATGTHLARLTLAEAESRLPAFARIHRTCLVRRTLVRTIEPNASGDFVVRLDDGTELPMSRRHREALLGPE